MRTNERERDRCDFGGCDRRAYHAVRPPTETEHRPMCHDHARFYRQTMGWEIVSHDPVFDPADTRMLC